MGVSSRDIAGPHPHPASTRRARSNHPPRRNHHTNQPRAHHHEAPTPQNALVETIHAAAEGHDQLEFRDTLLDADITQHHNFLTDAVVNAVRTYPRPALKEHAIHSLLRTLHNLASGRNETQDTLAVPRLLPLTDTTTPTITVRLEDAFLDDVRRTQREDICQYLSELARGCDVRLVATGRQQLRLFQTHRTDLPVSHDTITPLADTPTNAQIDTAIQTLDPDGQPVQILHDLKAAPAETHSYHELYATHSVSKSRVRQCIATLTEHGLVTTYTAGETQHVDLLEAGKTVTQALASEFGRQSTLKEVETGRVSESGKPSSDSRVNSRAHEPARNPHRLADHHETHYLPRDQHAAATAAAPEGGVRLLDHPVEPADDRGSRGWSYDDTRDRMVVSAEYDNPLQYWVCTALALADHRTWTQILTLPRSTSS